MRKTERREEEQKKRTGHFFFFLSCFLALLSWKIINLALQRNAPVEADKENVFACLVQKHRVDPAALLDLKETDQFLCACQPVCLHHLARLPHSLTHPPVCLLVRLSVYSVIHLTVCLSTWQSIYLSVCLLGRPPVCLSIQPSTCLSVYSTVRLPACLST